MERTTASEFSVGFLILLLATGSVYSAAESDDWTGKRWTFRSDERSSGEKTVVAANGDTVALQCQFRVSGWSTVQWLKFEVGDDESPKAPVVLLGSVTSTNGSFSMATLKNVNEGDEGNYSCVLATLLSGSKSYLFQVAVKNKLACRVNSCSSNGNCVETIDGYTCECEKGFIGASCELRDPCSDSPCQNNGTCVADGGDFNCSCVTGYGGDNCESQVCTPNICSSGGSCREKDGKIFCVCPQNQAGDRCQYVCRMNSYPYCSYNTRTCKISVGFHGQHENCVCDRRRRLGGNRCMMESDVRNECEDQNICNGHGNCQDYVFGYQCNCYSYAQGTNCEIYDECNAGDNLCASYGGTCVDLTQGYKCTNCPEGQYGDKCQYTKNPCKVTCHGSSMTVTCPPRFLSKKMKTIPLFLNQKIDSCRLPQWSRSLTVAYTTCGTEIEYRKDYVVYRNYLRVGNSEKINVNFNSIITRAMGHFSFKMECTLPLLRNASEELTDLSLLANETLDLQDEQSIRISGTNILIYRDNYSRQIHSYVVGDRLYVKMTIDTDSNPAFSRGFKLYPVTCFATSGRNGVGERYVLVEDGCILDETFRLENGTHYRADHRHAYFSFDSFSFKSDPGKLYLHCTSVACLNTSASTSHEKCGAVCENGSDSAKNHATSAPLGTSPRVGVNGIISRTPGPSVEVFASKSSA